MTLGNRIGQYRRKLGLTQDALAKQLDVTNQAVSKWESDQCCPDISLLPKIADIFGITMDELFGRAAPAPEEPAPVEEAPTPAPENEDEPPQPEPDPIPEPEEPAGGNGWKGTYWGKMFHRTIGDFASLGIELASLGKEIEQKVRKDFDQKFTEAFNRQAEPVEEDFDSCGDTVRERTIPDDIELDWEDDQTLRVALFVGKKLIAGHPAEKRIEFCYEGPALNIHSAVSVTCDSVAGNVWAGGDVTCDDVSGCVTAGGDVSCDSVGGNVQTGGDVSCEDVGGCVEAGGDVTCDSIHGDVKAGGDVNCDEVLGHVTASGDVNCDEIQGNVHAEGDVSCDHLEGNITAGGSIQIG